MRQIPQGLAERLEGPATTLARCWRLTRADGRVFGFTDHDERLSLAGTDFEAATGLTAGEAEASLGLAAGSQDVEGAFAASAITEEDIASGLFDGARVETFVVDWREPTAHMALSVAELGEVKRGGGAFTAELRGIEAALDRQRGRVYQRRCSAALGDARCRVDSSADGRTRDGVVTAESRGSLLVGGLQDLDRALFTGGRLTLPGRPGAPGREIVSLGEGIEAGDIQIGLIEPFAGTVAAGEAVRLTAGCDKSFGTCRARFANHLNFRGFPHLPGLDTALQVGKQDGLHDGSPVVP